MNDPLPWRHASGARVEDPGAPGAPQGGYTFDPREGYDDHPERFISTRSPGRRPRPTSLPTRPVDDLIAWHAEQIEALRPFIRSAGHRKAAMMHAATIHALHGTEEEE